MAQGRTAVSKAAAQDAQTDGEISTKTPFPGTCSICPQALDTGTVDFNAVIAMFRLDPRHRSGRRISTGQHFSWESGSGSRIIVISFRSRVLPIRQPAGGYRTGTGRADMLMAENAPVLGLLQLIGWRASHLRRRDLDHRGMIAPPAGTRAEVPVSDAQFSAEFEPASEVRRLRKIGAGWVQALPVPPGPDCHLPFGGQHRLWFSI